MTIGFHYHIPIKIDEHGNLYTAGHFGLFLDAIADECKKLIVFAYTPLVSEISAMDYAIRALNIQHVNLGPHNNLPSRFIRFPKHYKLIKRFIPDVDVFLVRSPTPLVMIFPALKKRKQVVLYLVGDYKDVAKSLSSWNVRILGVKLINHLVERFQIKLAKDNLILSNGPLLLDKYSAYTNRGVVVKSTTLTPEDFLWREDTCQNPVVRILFTGRIDPTKGLNELLEACETLALAGKSIELHLAGLVAKGYEEFPLQLKLKAESGVLKDRFFFHGAKKVGTDLNAIYRQADIYVIASYSEGFPRTIWEAMANSLPVISTRVGSIPHFLSDQQNAILIPPFNVDALVNAIKLIIENQALRKQIILEGYQLAQENTLQAQAKKMVEILSRNTEKDKYVKA